MSLRGTQSLTLKSALTGLKALQRRLKHLQELDDLDPAIRGIAQDIRSEAAANLNGSGLSSETAGRIAASLLAEKGQSPTSYFVHTPIAQAHFVEFGTHQSAPRPWFGPAIAKILPIVNTRLRKILHQAIRKA